MIHSYSVVIRKNESASFWWETFQGILLSKKEQDTKQSVGKLPFVQNKEEREIDFFFFMTKEVLESPVG